MPDIYLYIDGQQKGPYGHAELRSMIAAGLSIETPAWHSALTEWSTVARVLMAFPAPPPPSPGPPPVPPQFRSSSKGMPGCWIAALITGVVGFFLFFVLAGIALGPITNGIKKAKENASMQSARAIQMAMFAYAVDHDDNYPTGQTSTEVFQKLLDGNYVEDPALFYLQIAGKVRATSKKLVAENVCYDVTGGITKDSSDEVPVVYSEGYQVTYALGAAATPDREVVSPFPGMAVAYKSNRARFLSAEPDGTVPNVIPPTFEAGNGNYRQLRP